MSEPSPYDHLFRRGAGPQFPFQDESWELLLFVERLPKTVSRYFEPLARAARQLGDSTVIIADEHEPSTRTTVEWEPQAYARAVFDCPLGALVYGDSGRWAMVITDEEFACLGGEPAFVGRVASELGGREAVHAEFEAWLQTAQELLFSQEKAAALRALQGWKPRA